MLILGGSEEQYTSGHLGQPVKSPLKNRIFISYYCIRVVIRLGKRCPSIYLHSMIYVSGTRIRLAACSTQGSFWGILL